MAFVGSLSGSGGASNTINVTGSMIIANPGTGGAFPSFPGTDAVFFVSGALGGKAAGSRTVSVFGGDVVASGSITVGTGSITITSNEIQFLGGIAKIYSGTSGLTFADSTGTKTLASLATGGGDVTGPASSTDNAIARFDLTTGKIIQNSDVAIGDASGGAVSIDAVTSTTVNLFNTNATTAVNIGGQAPAVSIGKTAGIVTTAGKLKVTGNEIQSSTGELALAFTGSNVIIPGDLTVLGTTVTVDATTLTIEDPVIGLGFTSGSTATTAGDRGFIGGMSTGGNVALFWDNTDSTFTTVRTTTSAGNDPVAITSYTPFRASSYQIGGTPGSAVAAGSAYLSSSDALNVLVNHTATTTFTKSGTPTIQIGDYLGSTGEGQIKGVTTGNALAPLWLSGSVVKVGAGSISIAGLDDIGSARITPVTSGGGVRFEGRDGAGISLDMVVSGSKTTIGANTGVVIFEGGGVPYLTASAAGGAVNLTAGAGIGTASVFNSVSTTVNFAQAATTINMGNVAGTNNVAGTTKFTQGLSGSLTKLTDGTSYLIAGTNISVTTGSNGAVTIASIGGGDVTGPGSSTDTAIARFNGLTGKIIQNTAGVTIDGSNNVVTSGSFSTKDGAGTVVAVIKNTGEITGSNMLLSGDLAVNGGDITTTATTFNLVTGSATTVNFAQSANAINIGKLSGGAVVTVSSILTGSNPAFFGDTVSIGGPGQTSLITTQTTANLFDTTATTLNFARAATTITAGASGGSTTFQGNLTGSNVLASSLTVTNGASFGGGFGSTGVSISTTGNIAANGTLLIEGATTLSGSVILGDATGDDLIFNGYAASSLIPKTTNSFDLGTPDLRWRNMYTGDLHLKNERGDWTVIEEEDYLTLTNNKSGKRYKFVLEEI